MMAWHDFVVPKEKFTRGVNGSCSARRRSRRKNMTTTSTWRSITASGVATAPSPLMDGAMEEKLTILGGNGGTWFASIRSKETQVRVDWAPGTKSRLEDPARLIGYAGSPRW